MNKFLAVGLVGCLLSADYSQAAPRLHAVFADHAVLQRDTPVPVWGWAEPGEAITVTCAGQTHRTAADTRGEWTVTLAAMPAGGPFDLTVEGKGRQAVKDLLFGDVGDVHCKNKQEIARRLALIARAQVYGEPLEYSGPVVDTVTFAEHSVQVAFTHADGLCFRDGKASGFEVAGADGVYHVATGEIQGNKLIVRSPEVATPIAIRYAWRDTPEVSLYNAATLPASPFRAAR